MDARLVAIVVLRLQQAVATGGPCPRCSRTRPGQQRGQRCILHRGGFASHSQRWTIKSKLSGRVVGVPLRDPAPYIDGVNSIKLSVDMCDDGDDDDCNEHNYDSADDIMINFCLPDFNIADEGRLQRIDLPQLGLQRRNFGMHCWQDLGSGKCLLMWLKLRLSS